VVRGPRPATASRGWPNGRWRAAPAGYGEPRGSPTEQWCAAPAGYGAGEGGRDRWRSTQVGYDVGEGLAVAVGDAVPDGVADAPGFGLWCLAVGVGVGAGGGGEYDE
jgi:hypothetical protein